MNQYSIIVMMKMASVTQVFLSQDAFRDGAMLLVGPDGISYSIVNMDSWLRSRGVTSMMQLYRYGWVFLYLDAVESQLFQRLAIRIIGASEVLYDPDHKALQQIRHWLRCDTFKSSPRVTLHAFLPSGSGQIDVLECPLSRTSGWLCDGVVHPNGLTVLRRLKQRLL